jgi:hypothetical protein
MSKSRKEIMGAFIGTLLGDSYISNRGEFGCQQVTKDLIEYKKDIFSNYASSIKMYVRERKARVSISDTRTIHGKKSYVLYSNRHKFFNKIRNLMYKSNKQVSMTILNKLTPLGIALWVMDDGYMDYKKLSNTKNIRICTDSFDEQSIRNIITYFNNVHNIQAKVFYHKRNKNDQPKPRISFNASNSQKLIVLIHKYMLPSFYYKLDMHYKETTLQSVRCSSEYIKAVQYMTQRNALNLSEDIV